MPDVRRIQVDYNARDRTGQCLRRRVPASWGLEVGDEVIAFEPSEGTELDAIVWFVSPPYGGPVWGERSTNPEPQPWQIVHLKPMQWEVRDIVDEIR
jgi:hypothetical protein